MVVYSRSKKPFLSFSLYLDIGSISVMGFEPNVIEYGSFVPKARCPCAVSNDFLPGPSVETGECPSSFGL